MQLTLTGASGFLGNRLVARLLESGHRLRILGRHKPATLAEGVSFYHWDVLQGPPPPEALEAAEAVIHFAGEPVAQRWSPQAKERIRKSRIDGTHALIHGIGRLSRKPKAFIGASAIGYYGDRGEEILTETSAAGSGFLADICVAWEQAEQKAQSIGLEVTRLRLGVVLGPNGGALGKMLLPFRLGIGGPIGNGRQWMSWVHVEDVVGMIEFLLAQPAGSGVFNVTSPSPVRNAGFAKALGQALHRPAFLPVPVRVLKLLYGEMADMVIASQRVEPMAAQRAGYRFRFHDVKSALDDLLAG
ncbi:MAG TPA: TIGR01777 family oxidoreductase [Bryobacteraceae bacterium]|nr:TIGR01777 family oxidoreductase [Bryobacteraceae bacterium]